MHDGDLTPAFNAGELASIFLAHQMLTVCGGKPLLQMYKALEECRRVLDKPVDAAVEPIIFRIPHPDTIFDR